MWTLDSEKDSIGLALVASDGGSFRDMEVERGYGSKSRGHSQSRGDKRRCYWCDEEGHVIKVRQKHKKDKAKESLANLTTEEDSYVKSDTVTVTSEVASSSQVVESQSFSMEKIKCGVSWEADGYPIDKHSTMTLRKKSCKAGFLKAKACQDYSKCKDDQERNNEVLKLRLERPEEDPTARKAKVESTQLCGGNAEVLQKSILDGVLKLAVILERIGMPSRESHSSSSSIFRMLKLMTLISSSLLIHMIKLLSLVLFFTTATQVTCRLSNETDRLALLSFKELIAEDPLGSLSSWNNSLYLCKWDGVTCSRKHQRVVVVLDLRGKSLSGMLSTFLGNLSCLSSLYLQNNIFQGKIPLELGLLFRLQHMNLSFNYFQGEIPTNLSNFLTAIDFKSNNLVGKIPASFGSLSKLTYLDLYSNNLIGGIPPFLGNLSLLQKVDFGLNSFTGIIPHSISRLGNLKGFGIRANKLSGTVPPPLYNISTLTQLIIGYNQLTGSLPQDIGLTLPNLRKIVIGPNKFRGPFPVSFCNASRMEMLDLSTSNLSGPVPFDLGRMMKDLFILNLGKNNLGSGDSSDLRFIDSLTNCSKLQKLLFYGNGFGGVLPTTIANLSNQLIKLSGSVNQLVGTIPEGIFNLVNLAGLFLEDNLPCEIGKLRNLQQLSLSRNKLFGPIPSSICNLTQMYRLSLEENNFNSSLPSGIENIPGLQILNLSYDVLAGPIPNTIGLSTSLTFLNLAHNTFMGALPLEIGKLNNLQELDALENKLSGHIPSTLGNCLKLKGLFLEGNTFQGSIPPSFSSLRGLEILDLSRNNLSGQIQEDIAALRFLLESELVL
ncbi:putative receptor-like protein kinase At3g47110 [Rhododendron vialii]|uniref:putative receptor-like protein kinase At3g47110 n=1 Tax=Rhododendron vialii TaxID=182163 RepID=UPI00265E7200|nr:putative receptor-like protein kinase At3g47110 [Rhododendron vialii]